jgi:predicted transcriptional regulator of viral defense system
MARLDDVQALLGQHSTLTAELLRQHGIHRSWIAQLVNQGVLVRVARGIYAAADAENVGPHHNLAVATQRVPAGVICLLSALRFHDIGTQLPAEVWMGLPRGTRIPADPTIHTVHYSPTSFDAGVEHHRIENSDVRIYSPAKTVADCFKYRSQIGLEAAIEALRETVRSRKATVAEIHAFADICRIRTVITPYLQALA